VEAALPVRTIAAEPEPLAVDIGRMALVIIDMQRDFLEPGGFGAALGNDISRLKSAVGPCADVLAAARRAGILIIHTREGHRADLTDAPPIKVERGDPCGSVRWARWAASSCAASLGTTSSPSFIRPRANR
jgi:nicotinamidase-related amidase